MYIYVTFPVGSTSPVKETIPIRYKKNDTLKSILKNLEKNYNVWRKPVTSAHKEFVFKNKFMKELNMGITIEDNKLRPETHITLSFK